MKKFVVCYYDKTDDYCKVWVYANNAKEAEAQARREYWNIARISTVYELK